MIGGKQGDSVTRRTYEACCAVAKAAALIGGTQDCYEAMRLAMRHSSFKKYRISCGVLRNARTKCFF